ncbi:MAG TPA: L-lactate permease [Candidatus Acidoferrales bacterium]|nr:L-lactate permease [Candidatus Acidoferrales bacterium]
MAQTATQNPTPAGSAPPPPRPAGSLSTIFIALVAVGIVALAWMGPAPAQPWAQGYDPLGSWWLSTICAALPVIVLLGTLAIFHFKAHNSAFLGLLTALLIAVGIFHMPVKMAGITAIYGAGFGLFPIGWIILSVIFLYRMTLATGRFKVLQESMTGITQDTRLQLLLIAFSFGAFFEGASGFGTPVAVTAALLIGLGFEPLPASGLSLIANTAPVAFGALGTPIVALAAVTGYSEVTLGAQVGRILPFFSILVPFWLIWAYAGFKGMKEIWPAITVAGVTFAVPQYLVSNYHGPWLTDIIAAVASMLCLIVFLKFWHPKKIWGHGGPLENGQRAARASHGYSRGEVVSAWLPWLILSVLVFCWGTFTGKKIMNTPEKVFTSMSTWQTPPSKITNPQIPVAGLDKLVQRVPPVVPKPAAERAVFSFNWLSATGTGILIAALISGLIMGLSIPRMFVMWWQTVWHIRFSLITIAAMLSLGIMTRYSGVDATMGLAFARTGHLYPFFGTLLGWLGVALTGSDTSSNVLFGSLQKISAQQIGISPVLMGAANSAGGVMGKMIDAQSIVVASTATEWYGHEGTILRYVFWHSIALACLVGIMVFLQAYVFPFTQLVAH